MMEGTGLGEGASCIWVLERLSMPEVVSFASSPFAASPSHVLPRFHWHYPSGVRKQQLNEGISRARPDRLVEAGMPDVSSRAA